MQGEFRGDFTRDTFHPEKHFLRVFTQQGRVQIDADPNEQSSIIIHHLQSLAVDLMGPHAAPFEGGGFTILATDKQINAEVGLNPERKTKLKTALKENGLIISKGKYYVNGILCDNDDYIPFFDQPAPPFPLPKSRKSPLDNGKKYLIYLDIWERHINYIQDEMSSGNDLQNPSIREVALAGSDTTTRSQIIWQVKFKLVTDEELKNVMTPPVAGNLVLAEIAKIAQALKDDHNTVFIKALGESVENSGRGTGQLKARAKKSDVISSDPCIVNPNSSYKRTENQLYRVEIHKDGNQKIATFKWSRENSSVVFPISKPVVSSDNSSTITLAHLGQDDRFTLKEQDWVEIVDDDYIIQNNPNDSPLFKIESIDRGEQIVVLSGEVQNVGKDLAKHPFLRRWDREEQIPASSKNNNGVQDVEEGEDKWLPLENGIEICFPTENSSYKKGDYWLIPARTATGDVEWPGTFDKPTPLPPHGIVHNYAPLALISLDGNTISPFDCRRKLIKPWN